MEIHQNIVPCARKKRTQEHINEEALSCRWRRQSGADGMEVYDETYSVRYPGGKHVCVL